MRNQTCLFLAALALFGCQTTTDPSAGGFLSGVSALSSGAYEQRAVELDEQEASERARQAELRQELAALQGEYAMLQRAIRQQRVELEASGASLPAQLDARIKSTLNTSISNGDAVSRLASLRRAVSAARSISAELAELSS